MASIWTGQNNKCGVLIMKKIMLIALLASGLISGPAFSKSPDGNFGVKYEYFISQGYRLLDSGMIPGGIGGTTTHEKYYMTFLNEKSSAETKLISCTATRDVYGFGKISCYKI